MHNYSSTAETQATNLIREIRRVEKFAYDRDKNSSVGFMLTRQRNQLLRSLLKGRGEPITARLQHGGRN